jgi:hypothetical protein
MPDRRDQALVFDSVSNRALRGYGAAAAAVLLVAVAVASFFLGLRTNRGPLALHATTTLPMIAAVGLFGSAFVTLRSPSRVVVGQHELTVMRGQARLGRWRWDEIAHAPTGQLAVSHKRSLRLYDTAGKLLITLTDDLHDFDGLSREIKRRMTEHPSPQRAAVATARSRRTGAMLMIGGVLFFALAAVNAWFAVSERRAAELLRTQGQPAQAIIVRKFTAPDGRTRRIEYTVDAPGAPVENVEVTPALWALAQPNQRIPVIAVPGRPDVSHLATGQVDDSMHPDPQLMLVLSGAMAVMSTIFFVVGLLNRRGIDIKWDKSRFRPKLVRAGEE